MVIVDSCVLIDILSGDERFADSSAETLSAVADRHELAINPLIYAEVAGGAPSQAVVDRHLPPESFRRLELPYGAAFLAARAFARYRRAGGTRRSPLADFYIGAHAALIGCAIVTRDVRRFRSYFPSVELIVPS